MLLALLVASLSFPKNVQVTTYEVSGNSAREIRQEINERRPEAKEGKKRYDARAAWQLSWHFWTNVNPQGQCYLSKVSALASVQVILPHWQPPEDADAALLQEWNAYYKALLEHENGHVQIADDAARAVEQLKLTLGTRADCAALSADFRAGANAALEDGKRQTVEYDAQTNHGATQGARFPK